MTRPGTGTMQDMSWLLTNFADHVAGIAHVVAVSICTVLAFADVAAINRAMARDRRWGGNGMVGRPFCYKRAVLYSEGFLQNDVFEVMSH